MTEHEARMLALAIREHLPHGCRARFKAVHIAQHLHQGHLTVRVFMVPVTADDPTPYIYTADDLG